MGERLTISDIRQHQRMGGSFHPRSYSASLEDTALAALAEVESLQAQLAAAESEVDDKSDVGHAVADAWENRCQELEQDLAAVRTDLSVARAALEKIDKYGCSTYTGTHRCLDANSGRTRGAEFRADAWCDPCIARDALGPVATRHLLLSSTLDSHII